MGIEAGKIDFDAWDKEIAEQKPQKSTGMDFDSWDKEISAGEEVEQRGLPGDIVSGIVRGVAVEMPSLFLDTVGATERIARKALGYEKEQEVGPIGEMARAGKEGLEQFRSEHSILRAKEKPGIISQGVEAAAMSISSGAPGAVAGFGIGSLFGPASPVTAPMGALIGFAMSGGLTFGLAEYENVIQLADEQGIDRAESEPAAIWSGLAEGGFEFASDLITGGLLKVAKPLTAPAKEGLKSGIRQVFKMGVKEALARSGAVLASETSMEMLTAGVQAEQYKKIGLGDATFWEGAKQAMGPAFVASVIFAGIGTGATRLHQVSIRRKIENGAIDPKKRMQAANEVGEILGQVDKDLAKVWRINATEAIKNKENIDIDDPDLIRATAVNRADQEPGGATPENIEVKEQEIKQEIHTEKQDDIRNHISLAVAIGEINDVQAHELGRSVGLGLDEVNQALIRGTGVQQMFNDADPIELRPFAVHNDIAIPDSITDGNQMAAIIQEGLKEEGSVVSELAKQVKNLEQTAKTRGMEHAAETLAKKKAALDKMLPEPDEVYGEAPPIEKGFEKEAEGDREEGKQLVGEVGKGEEPGGAIPKPETGGEEVETGGVLQTPEEITPETPVVELETEPVPEVAKPEKVEGTAADESVEAEKPISVRLNNGEVVTRSARTKGKFQTTRFTEEGEPAGHEEHNTLSEAIKDNYKELDNPVSRLAKNTPNAVESWEEATFEHPHKDELQKAPYAYVSPLRPLTGVGVKGKVSADKSGRVGVLYRDTPLPVEKMESLSLIPVTPKAVESFAVDMANKYEGIKPKATKPELSAEDKAMRDMLKPGTGEFLRKNGLIGPEKTVHDYSNTQVNLPEESAKPIKDLAQKIPEEELYTEPDNNDYGREDAPHITVRYGLETTNPKDIEPAFKDLGPVKVKFGKVSIFETDNYDVVKVDIESPDLEKANKKVGETVDLPGETFKDYKPHATIAYVKKGEGKKYIGDKSLEGQETVIDSIFLSSKDGKMHEIKLTPESTEPTNPPWEMNIDEFEKFAEGGKIHKATGKELPGEDKAKTPLALGEINKYSPQDIAKFYQETHGKDAHRELLRDAKAEGKAVPEELLGKYAEAEAEKPVIAEEGEGKAKEPWEMTRSEYGKERLPEVLRSVKKTSPITKTSALQKKAEDIVSMEHEASIRKAKLEGKIPSKDIGWQQTKAEIQEKIDSGILPKDYLTGGSHERFVKHAINEGKPVPKEVLAEYPDLKPPPSPEGTKVAPEGKEEKEPIGTAWVKNAQKPIIAAREIKSGKHKGKVEVTLTAGRDAQGNVKPGKKVKVDRKSVVEWPGEAKKPKEEIKITGKEDKTVSVEMLESKAEDLTPKEQKKYLLAEIDKAIDTAVDNHIKGNNLKGSVAQIRKQFETEKYMGSLGSQFYKFEVPGDGEFDIAADSLIDFKKRVKSQFPAAVRNEKFRPSTEGRINYGAEINKYKKLIGKPVEKLKPSDIADINEKVREAKVYDSNHFTNWLLNEKVSEDVKKEILKQEGIEAKPKLAEGEKEPLYSTAEPKNKTTEDQVWDIILPYMQNMTQFPTVKFAQSEEQLSGRIRKQVVAFSKKSNKKIEGFYDKLTDTVWFIGNNLSKGRVLPVFKHEGEGHRGIRLLLGPELDGFLDGISKAKKDELLKHDPKLNFKDQNAVRVAADEWCARKIEAGNLGKSFWDDLVRIFRKWLRKFVPNLNLTDGEIRSVLTDTVKNVREGRIDRMGEAQGVLYSGKKGDKEQAMTSKKGPGDITTTETSKSPMGGNPFKDSKIKKIVYHGTDKSFDEFNKSKSDKFFINELSELYYFSPSKKVAKSYAGDKGNIYKVYLDVKNPIPLKKALQVAEESGVELSVTGDFVGEVFDATTKKWIEVPSWEYSDILSEYAVENGYDGFRVYDSANDEMGEYGLGIVVLDKSQIKILPKPSSPPGKGGQEDLLFSTAPDEEIKTLEQEIKTLQKDFKEKVKTTNIKQSVLDATGKLRLSDIVKETRTLTRETYQGVERKKKGIALLKEKAKRQESLFNAKIKKAARDRVNKIIKGLKKINTKRMSPEQASAINGILDAVDLTKLSLKKQLKLERTRQYFDNNPDAEIPDYVLKNLERLDKSAARDLTLDDLESLNIAVLHHVHLDAVKQKIRVGRQERQRTNVLNGAMGEMKTPKKVRSEIISSQKGPLGKVKRTARLIADTFGIRHDHFDLIIESLSGVNSIMDKVLYQNVKNGITEELKYKQQTFKKFQEDLGDFEKKHKIKDMSKWMAEVVKNGRIELTRGERMSLYRHSLNADNKKAIIQGGFGFKFSDEPNRVHNITEDEFNSVIDSLTDAEKEFAGAPCDNLFADQIERLDAVFLEKNGYPMPREENYHPKDTMPLARGSDIAVEDALERFKGTWLRVGVSKGMLEKRKRVSLPIYLNSITYDINTSVSKSAAYIGLELPLSNASKLLYDPTFRLNLSNNYGEQTWREIEKGLRDIAGEYKSYTTTEQLALKAKNQLATAMLGFNPFVVSKQILSLPVYLPYVKSKYLAMGLLDNIWHPREITSRHKMYSPEYLERIEGGYSRDVADVFKAGAEKRVYGGAKSIKEKLMSGIKLFDQAAVNMGMHGAVLQTLDEFKAGKLSREVRLALDMKDSDIASLTPERKMALAYKFADYATQRTQPMFSPEHRSSLSRGSTIEKLGTMFGSFTNQALNLTRRSYREAVRTGDKQAYAKFSKSLMVIFVINTLGVMAIDDLRDRLYGREGKSFVGKVLSSWSGYMFFVRDLASSVISKIERGTFLGYDVSIPVSRIPELLSNVIANGVTVLSEEDIKKRKKAATNFVDDSLELTTMLSGIPYATPKKLGGRILFGAPATKAKEVKASEEHAKTIRTVRKNYKELLKTDPNKAVKYYAKHKNEIRMWKYASNISSRISRMQKRIDTIMESKTLTPDAKRRKVVLLNDAMLRMAQRFNKRYVELK